MNDSSVLCLRRVVRPSSVTDSCSLVGIESEVEYLVLASGNAITCRAPDSLEASSLVAVPGSIVVIHSLGDRMQLFVLYCNRGIYRYCLLSGPPHLTDCTPHHQLPESAGSRLRSPVFSNQVNGVFALQTREGSIYIFRYVGSANPTLIVTRFDLPKSAAREPIICMAMFERATNDYCLVALTGDAETIAQLSLYSVRWNEDGKLSFDLISNPPKTFTLIADEIKPYFVCTDETSESLLFIGGDSQTYSAIGTFSVSELLRSSSSIDFNHCQPLPRALAIGSKDCFYICSSFGEIYCCNKRFGRNQRLELVRSDVPTSFAGPTCMTLYSKNLFIGSRVGDSILYPLDPVEKPSVVVRCVAPILDFGPSDPFKSITTIGGVGNSARINRIITSGIGSSSLESETCIKCERLFVVNDEFLISSNPIQSKLYQIKFTPESLLLTELGVSVPAKVMAANSSVIVTEEGVFEFPSFNSVWRSPLPITACDMDKDFLVLVGSGRSVVFFEQGKRIEASPFGEDEIACVATRGKQTVFGLSRTVVLGHLAERRVVWSSDSTGPNSLRWIDEGTLAIGLRDGTVVVVELNKEEVSFFSGGVVPVTFNKPGFPLFISGDKPGCLLKNNGALDRIDIVNARTGALDLMSCIQVLKFSERTLIMYLDESGCVNGAVIRMDKTKESHIQRSSTRIFGDHLPILVGLEEQEHNLMVGVTHADAKDQVDSLVCLDSKKFNEVCNKVNLPPGERVSSISVGRVATDTSRDYGEDVLVVGTMSENDGGEPIAGKVIFFENDQATDVSTITVLSEDGTGPAGPVTCTLIVSGFLVVSAGRTVSVFKRGNSSLVHCASLDVDYYVTSIDGILAGSKLCILTGDLSRSVTLLEFSDNTISVIGKDWTPAAVTKVSFVDTEKFAFSDDVGNLYIGSLLDPPSQRIERIEGICLGAVVTAMKRVDGKIVVGLENGTVLNLIECEAADEECEDVFVGRVYDPNRDQSHIPMLRYEDAS